jgi:uncharacterized protein YjbI with pentapeptide repeats
MTDLPFGASYQAKNLQGIVLHGENLSGWNFSGQNLTNADLAGSTLRNADLAGADLINTFLESSTLTNADLTGANLKNANLGLASLESAVFSSNTVYNQWTLFPISFDPVEKGLTFMPSPPGDFDANAKLDVADIEMLQSRIRGTLAQNYWLPSSMFDLAVQVDQVEHCGEPIRCQKPDSTVTQDDLAVWVKDFKHTYFGDANLDGEFNSADLVQVFAAGKYEATERGAFEYILNPATWSTGDWNTDGEFTTGDLVLAFQDASYEAGPREGIAVVPEPSDVAMVLICFTLGSIVRRSRLKPRPSSGPRLASLIQLSMFLSNLRQSTATMSRSVLIGLVCIVWMWVLVDRAAAKKRLRR